MYRNAFPPAAPTCQTFGLYRLSWPRPEVLAAATRRFAQRLLQRWTAKEAAHLREPDRRVAGRPVGGAEAGVRADRRAVRDGGRRDALREDPERGVRRVHRPAPDAHPVRRPDGRGGARAACSSSSQAGRQAGVRERAAAGLAAAGPRRPRTRRLAKEAEGHLAVMAVHVHRAAAVPAGRGRGGRAARSPSRLKRQIEVLEPVKADLERRSAADVRPAAPDDRRPRLAAAWAASWPGSRRWPRTCSTCSGRTPASGSSCTSWTWCLSVYRKLLGQRPGVPAGHRASAGPTLADLHAAMAKAGGGGGRPGRPGQAHPAGRVQGPGRRRPTSSSPGCTPDDLLAFDQTLQKDTRRRSSGGLANVCLKPAREGRAVPRPAAGPGPGVPGRPAGPGRPGGGVLPHLERRRRPATR